MTNNNADFISQAERRRIMANDRRATTYHSFAQSSINDERGGRYSAIDDRPAVTGSSPIAYPQLPEGNPWAKNELPDEPPTGIDINAQDPTGEVFEVKASEQSPSSPSSPVSGDGEVGDRATATSPVIRSKFRRRI